MAESFSVARRSKIQKRLALILLHDLTKKAEAVHILASAGHAHGIEILARNSFELLLDLINLYQYPQDYAAYLFYCSSRQQLKGIQAILDSPESPFSKSISDQSQTVVGMSMEEMKSHSLNETEDFKSKLNRRFIKGKREAKDPQARVAMRIEDKAKWAGKLDEYNSIYRMYSRATHSDIGPMFKPVLDGFDMIWPARELEPSSMAVNLITSYLIDASRLVCKKQRRPVSNINMIDRQRQHEIGRILQLN